MQQTPEVSSGMAATDAMLNGCDSKQKAQQTEMDNGDESNGTASASLMSEPCLQGIEFLQKLKNPDNLQPVSLPLQLKLFARIPVVVSARLFGQTGKPSETFAHLLIK